MGSTIEATRAFLRARWRPRRVNPAFDITALPVETAQDFEANFAQRNALGLTLEQARTEAERELAGCPPRYPGFSFGLSTGTMGAPGVFLTSELERSRWLGAVLGKFLPLRLLVGARIALVLKHNNQLYNGVRLRYYNAAEPVEQWVGRLCAAAPDILIGPVNILEQIAASDAFTRRPFRPALLLVGAEPMFPQDATLLEQRFGSKPRGIYQAKEGFLASGCTHGRLHLNEDLVYFERLELGRGRFVPLITDVTRTSQRYWRFRLDDILLAAPGSCPCGSPFTALTAVEGRANDVLLIGDRCLFPFEVNACCSGEYCITQISSHEVTLSVQGGRGDWKKLAELVKPAVITRVEYRSGKPGEKRRRIRRLFDAHNDWLRRFTVSRNARSGS